MTWVKLPDDALEDPRVAGLSDEELVAYLRALAWSNRWARDGNIPESVAGPHQGAWIGAGMARATDDGVRIEWLLKHQPSADEIERRKDRDAERQARRRRHVAGDHSRCDPERCKALLAQSRRDSVRDSGRESDHPDPARPDPTLGGEETGGSGAGDGLVADAVPARTECDECGREFLGDGYASGSSRFCSARCLKAQETVDGRYLRAVGQ